MKLYWHPAMQVMYKIVLVFVILYFFCIYFSRHLTHNKEFEYSIEILLKYCKICFVSTKVDFVLGGPERTSQQIIFLMEKKLKFIINYIMICSSNCKAHYQQKSKMFLKKSEEEENIIIINHSYHFVISIIKYFKNMSF
jgi:hypothetical protein